MSIHVSASSIRYRVVSQSMVTVRVTIGDGQGGGWVVAWDASQVIAKGSNPETVDIGRGQDIKGRALQVVTTAVDIRRETNRLSGTVTVEGGADGKRDVLATWDDGKDGDTAVFATMIGFE